MKNFFYCGDCLRAFFSEKEYADCPSCSEPMAISGFMQSTGEKGPDSPSESLPA
ncbi:hypothetical protein QFZ58_002058 [Streptomyces sp. B1I3]|nr:hypothetical protein [Streptomyces sp. B1I3]